MKSLPNILIVDDVEENISLLEEITLRIKVNVIKALSGDEALEKINGIELALAILDIRMPEMNGYELAAKINKERVGDRVQVIFVTASDGDEKDMIEGYNSGAADFIIKPVNPHILRSKIKVFLELFNQKQTIIEKSAQLKKYYNELVRSHEAVTESEGRLKDIIFSMADWMWEVDENGVYTNSSHHISDILGYTQKEIVGKTPFHFMSPEEGRRVSILVSEIMAKKSPIKDLENWNIRKDGKKICLLTNGVPIFDKKGNLKGYRGVDRDITRQIELEESLRSHRIELEMQNDELKESNKKALIATQKYSELYDFAPTGYFTLSKEEKIIELNHSGARMLGKERSHLIGKQFDNFISEEMRPVFNTFFQNVFKRNYKQICEVKLEVIDNQPNWLHIEGIVAVNGEQCLTNTIDITTRMMSEEMRQKSISMLNETGNIAKVGGWEFDVVNGIQTWTNETFRIFEIDTTEGEPLIPDSLSFYVPESRPVIELANQKAIQQGEPYDLQLEIITAKGNKRWVHTIGKANQKNGVTKSLSGVLQDVTERKLIEMELKMSEEKYRTMLKSSPDGILLVNLEGIITEASEIGLELFGAKSKDELNGKEFNHFVPSDDLNLAIEMFEMTLNEGLAQNIGLKIIKKNKSIFFSEISSTLIQALDGKPLSFMLIVRDISQRKKIEAKKLHADRMANLGEMASGMAHEINQPLNIISMVMDKILFETAKTEAINIEFLKNKSDKIFENIIRIRNIIDHVRAFSRNDDNYVLNEFDINFSIGNAVSMITEQFKHLGIRLNLKLDNQIPSVLGNTYKFEQVIVNLLANAKDAVVEKKSKQKGFSDMRVGINTFQENQFLIIEITDNGIGIDNEDIQEIMLPFYTTKEEGKGTGLGLSISYQIIQEMKGTIEIRSDRLSGTKIKLIIDLQINKLK
jgi:PAS domain S-box-containing protein